MDTQADEYILKEKRLNLEQAIAASSSCMACRVVGDRRVIVHREQELLTIHIQRKAKMHWIVDDDGGGVRYLSGLLRSLSVSLPIGEPV